eukprot:6490333-Amphidinium_carterae.2
MDPEIMSLQQRAVDRLLESPPSYPKLSSRGVREAGIRTLCMVHCEGSMDRIEGCYWSKLLQPGHIVSLASAVSGYLIFYSCRYGALGMKVGLAVRDKHPVLTGFFSEGAVMEYIVVENIAEWRTIGTRCIAPGLEGMQFLKEQGLQIVLAEKKGQMLPVGAIKNGMRGWTVPLLRKMWSELDVGSYPIQSKWKGKSLQDSGEIEIMTALTERVLKTDDTEVLSSVMSARNRPLLEPVADAIVLKDAESLDDLLGNGAADDSGAESGAEDLQEYRELLKEVVRAKTMKQAASVKTGRKRKAQTAGSTATGSASGQRIPFRKESPMSLQESKTYWPPGAKASLDIVRFNRWKVEAPYLPEMVTKVFGGRKQYSQDQSLLHCLRAAWVAYASSTGEIIPWDLDEALG